MARHSLYKYFTERKWADDFLNGKLLFRSLSYFRDLEDRNVREDQNEGNALFRPEGGLVVHNATLGTTITCTDWAFESRVKQDEIFIFCMSRSHTGERRKRFNAVACVEILDIPAFCGRVEAALPCGAKFPEPPGRPARIGWPVKYYHETESDNTRWALPEVIAASKLDSHAWQDEFRLVFSLTDALQFQTVDTRLVHTSNPREPVKPYEHHKYHANAQSLRDISRLHEFE